MYVHIDEAMLLEVKRQLNCGNEAFNRVVPELSAQRQITERLNLFRDIIDLFKRWMRIEVECNTQKTEIDIVNAVIDQIIQLGKSADEMAAALLNGEIADFITVSNTPLSAATQGTQVWNTELDGFAMQFLRNGLYELFPGEPLFDKLFFEDTALGCLTDITGITGTTRGEAFYDTVAGYLSELGIDSFTKYLRNLELPPAYAKKYGDILKKLVSDIGPDMSKFSSALSKSPFFKKLSEQLTKGGATSSSWVAGMGAAVIIDTLIDAANIRKEYGDKIADGSLTQAQGSAGEFGEVLASTSVNAFEGVLGTLTAGLIEAGAKEAGASAFLGKATALGGGMLVSIAAAIEFDMATVRFSHLTGDENMHYNSFVDLAGDTAVAYETNKSVEAYNKQFIAEMELLNAQREAAGLEPIDYDPSPTSTPSFAECIGENLGLQTLENIYNFFFGG